MVIGILQPGYLPWLGFFEQLYVSDVFVILDDVQYDKHGWRNRNRIKTADGAQWLTVPILLKFDEKPAICEVRIDNKINWRQKHLKAIVQNYRKAPYFDRYIGRFEEAYGTDWEYLVDLDMFFIIRLAEALGLAGKKIVRSSTLDVSTDRIDRLVEICGLFNANVFYEGAAGRNYLDESLFAQAGVKLKFQEYDHPRYSQLYGGFVSHLSVIDLLFNHGDESLSILLGSDSLEGKAT